MVGDLPVWIPLPRAAISLNPYYTYRNKYGTKTANHEALEDPKAMSTASCQPKRRRGLRTGGLRQTALRETHRKTPPVSNTKHIFHRRFPVRLAQSCCSAHRCARAEAATALGFAVFEGFVVSTQVTISIDMQGSERVRPIHRA